MAEDPRKTVMGMPLTQSRKLPPGQAFVVSNQVKNAAALRGQQAHFGVTGAYSVPIVEDEMPVETDEEKFKREWAEMLGLYSIISQRNDKSDAGKVLILSAAQELARRCKWHALPVTVRQLVQMKPTDAFTALAPRYLLKPVKPVVVGPFGPSVTAESEEDYADMMRTMRADPRYAREMMGAGFMAVSNLGNKTVAPLEDGDYTFLANEL